MIYFQVCVCARACVCVCVCKVMCMCVCAQAHAVVLITWICCNAERPISILSSKLSGQRADDCNCLDCHTGAAGQSFESGNTLFTACEIMLAAASG